MRIAVVQFDPAFGKVEQNIARATELITTVKADLFVLPELCFSGYTFKSRDEAFLLSESPDTGLSITRIKDLSSKIGAAIVFGFPERDEQSIYNSCALVAPNGSAHVYRKLHLFMHEKKWFSTGDRPPEVVEFRGCRIGMMICFDWIFPETARTLALKRAHLICHPANLVLPFCQAAMVTRSLENRVFTATANRVGRETRGGFDLKFTGRSQIISFRGQVLFRGSDDKDGLGIADIDYRESEDKSVNELNNLWADRRPELYQNELYGQEES